MWKTIYLAVVILSYLPDSYNAFIKTLNHSKKEWNIKSQQQSIFIHKYNSCVMVSSSK